MKVRGFTLIEVMIVIAILAILAVIAVPVITGDADAAGLFPQRRGALLIYTDPDTRCQYIQSDSDRSLTPRLDADGKQMCGGNH